MLFAGVLAEGGVIAYDTNYMTGGYGANVMGIGASTQYRKDVITVSLRLVSTNTGEVLLSVATTKTVFSASVSGNAMSFVSDGTKYGEIEAGIAGNEPVNLALRAAIDAAVIEIIKEGEQKGYWKFKAKPAAEPTSKATPPAAKRSKQFEKGLNAISDGLKDIIQQSKTP
jgi:curli production assembly/transport component CsgG